MYDSVVCFMLSVIIIIIIIAHQKNHPSTKTVKSWPSGLFFILFIIIIIMYSWFLVVFCSVAIVVY